MLLAAGAAASIFEMTPPIRGLALTDLRDTFGEIHDGHKHEATDIMEPRGTPLRAVVSGTIRKLFLSKPGGNTIYQFDDMGVYCYYYAHLDGYAEGLREGKRVERGEVIGFVGSTGNADTRSPHLHFAIAELGPDRLWWKGTAVDPYPFLVAAVNEGEVADDLLLLAAANEMPGGAQTYTASMGLKNAALFALIGTILLAVLLLAGFIRDLVSFVHGVVAAITLLTSGIHLLASLSVAVFFYVFHRSQP
jgi:hypothetical protein